MSPAEYRPTKTKVLVRMGLLFKNTLSLDRDILIDNVMKCNSSEILTIGYDIIVQSRMIQFCNSVIQSPSIVTLILALVSLFCTTISSFAQFKNQNTLCDHIMSWKWIVWP